jgi:predicted nucleic acid-binding protein
VLSDGVIGSCHPQRRAFCRSARSVEEYERMQAMFDSLHPDVPLPKTIWRWAESTQYRLSRNGTHRALSPVDLLLCGTASLHGLVILHDDRDFGAAARRLDGLTEHRVQDLPRL